MYKRKYKIYKCLRHEAFKSLKTKMSSAHFSQRHECKILIFLGGYTFLLYRVPRLHKAYSLKTPQKYFDFCKMLLECAAYLCGGFGFVDSKIWRLCDCCKDLCGKQPLVGTRVENKSKIQLIRANIALQDFTRLWSWWWTLTRRVVVLWNEGVAFRFDFCSTFWKKFHKNNSVISAQTIIWHSATANQINWGKLGVDLSQETFCRLIQICSKDALELVQNYNLGHTLSFVHTTTAIADFIFVIFCSLSNKPSENANDSQQMRDFFSAQFFWTHVKQVLRCVFGKLLVVSKERNVEYGVEKTSDDI